MTHLARCLLLLLIPWLAIPSGLLAQDASEEQRRKALLEGTEVFRRILFDEGFEPLDSFASLSEEPERTLLIVLGDLHALEDVPEGVVEFVKAGGAVLLASDRPIRRRGPWNQLGSLAGVSISAETLVCPQPSLCYKGIEYCPIVQPFPNTILSLFSDAATGKQLSVATNVPAKLYQRVRRLPGTIQRIGRLPPSYLITPMGHRLMPHDSSPLFAVAGEVALGRVLVLADHSVFINEMMLPQDTSNVDFTTAAVTWLRGKNGKAKQRDRVLFVEEGKIQTRLEIPLKSIAIPPEEALRMLFDRRNDILATGDNVLARLEDEAAFDNKTVELLERAGFSPGRLGRAAMILGTMLAAGFVIFRLGHLNRFRHDPTAPILSESIDRNLPVIALADQRYRALLKAGNLAEPAQHLARAWFVRFGVETWAGPLPRVAVVGGWWKRWRLVSRLRKVWRLAAGSGGRIRLYHLQALERELANLRAAHERGEWRLGTQESG